MALFHLKCGTFKNIYDINPNYDKEYFVFKGSSRIEAAVKMGFTHIEGIIINE